MSTRRRSVLGLVWMVLLLGTIGGWFARWWTYTAHCSLMAEYHDDECNKLLADTATAKRKGGPEWTRLRPLYAAEMKHHGDMWVAYKFAALTGFEARVPPDDEQERAWFVTRELMKPLVAIALLVVATLLYLRFELRFRGPSPTSSVPAVPSSASEADSPASIDGSRHE